MTKTALPTTIMEMEDGRPYATPLGKSQYEKELRRLQIEMLKAERHIKDHGERVVILFEGRDAAGKGGSIKRFTEHLNPRGARVVALSKPNETEATQWYFQRYVTELPTGGEMVLFDRSWYNRAGVERVMGFCTPRELAAFLRQVDTFEGALVDSGIRLFKLWFAVSRQEQLQRFEKRRSDPLRQWKLSPIDDASIGLFDAYTVARNEMLLATDTTLSPWTVVNSNEKSRARLESIRFVVNALDYDHKDESIAHEPDPRVVRPAAALSLV
jgi:polyphosphate kinase 2